MTFLKIISRGSMLFLSLRTLSVARLASNYCDPLFGFEWKDDNNSRFAIKKENFSRNKTVMAQ